MDMIKKLNEIFEYEEKLEEEKRRIKNKVDKLFEEKAKIAFELYEEFIANNSEFDKNSEYFKLYIDAGRLVVEEIVFNRVINNIVEFKHKSKYRQNICINLFLDTKRDDYTSDSVIIDKNQFDRLSKEFKIIVRK